MGSSNESHDPTSPGDANRSVEFVALYSESYPRLHYFLLALLPTSNDAADVLQETSLVLWKKFDTFQTGTNFFAWACRIARLQAMKHYDRMNRTDRLFDTTTLERLADDAMSIAAKPTPQLEILESCLSELNESDRMLIRRRYETGAVVNRMAAEMDVSANLLSKTLGRIRRALLACVEKKMAHEW